jgi:hypothetical protein
VRVGLIFVPITAVRGTLDTADTAATVNHFGSLATASSDERKLNDTFGQ